VNEGAGGGQAGGRLYSVVHGAVHALEPRSLAIIHISTALSLKQAPRSGSFCLEGRETPARAVLDPLPIPGRFPAHRHAKTAPRAPEGGLPPNPPRSHARVNPRVRGEHTNAARHGAM
jgi:hypothetical protein